MKNIIITITLLLLAIPTIAQQEGSYVNAKIGLGSSSLMYKLDGGDRKAGFGFNGAIGYSYFFTPNWGFGTGIGISIYNTKGFFDHRLFSFENQVDSEGDVYRKDVYLLDWEEKQRVTFLEVPLMANYQYMFGEKKEFGLYANAGFKVQIPMSASHKSKRGEVETQGYYAQWNVTLIDRGHGFTTIGDYHPNGSLDFKLGFAIAAELGVLYALNDKWSLHAGVAFDYGLKNIKSSSMDDLVYQNNLNETKYRGILMSNATKKVNPLSVRGEVGVRYRIGGKSKKTSPADDGFVQRVPAPYHVTELDNMDACKTLVDSLRDENLKLRNNNILLKRELYEEDVYILSEPIDHYELGKVVLTKTQRDKVDKYIEIIKKSPKMNILLEGHTCDIDSRNVNREVGLHRAEYIRDYLISKGIDARRIRISSKGETQPLVPNINEENRKRNRRVLFLVE